MLELVPEYCVTAPGYFGTCPFARALADALASGAGACAAEGPGAAAVAAAFDSCVLLFDAVLLLHAVSVSATGGARAKLTKRIDISCLNRARVAPYFPPRRLYY